jgi:AcrR family transcriptional regulator
VPRLTDRKLLAAGPGDTLARSMRTTKAKSADWGGRGDSDNRRDVILRALNSLLREHKRPESFRMQDLAEQLGVVKGNLYYYFKSKQDLMYHCRIKCLQESLEVLARAREKSGPASRRLHQLIRDHILVLIEGQYSAVLLLDMGSISVARRRKYVALRDEFEAGMRRLIEEGIKGGEFPHQDVRMAGFAILGSINWIPKWYRAGGPSTAAEIAEYQADFFMSALRAPKAASPRK